MAEFEEDVLPARRIGLVAGGLLLTVVVVALGIGGLLMFLRKTTTEPPTSAVERSALRPPLPRLQTAPEADLAALRRQEQQRLDGLGWTDRQAGLAHIPIDRAMGLLAERGWP
jgi:hypothetical protein